MNEKINQLLRSGKIKFANDPSHLVEELWKLKFHEDIIKPSPFARLLPKTFKWPWYIRVLLYFKPVKTMVSYETGEYYELKYKHLHGAMYVLEQKIISGPEHQGIKIPHYDYAELERRLMSSISAYNEDRMGVTPNQLRGNSITTGEALRQSQTRK